MSGTATIFSREAATEMTPTTITVPVTPVYNLHPAHLLSSQSLGQGFAKLAQQLVGEPAIRLDGVVGVDWEGFRAQLKAEFRRLNVAPEWVAVQSAMKTPEAIGALVEPFLGGDDPLFGTRFTGELGDFFDTGRLAVLQPATGRTVIFYGSGAALVDCEGPLVFVDVPKNEVQYRSRAGQVVNLGAARSTDPKAQYKRLYFVDWVVLNRHIANIASRVDLVVDDQQPDLPVFIDGQMLRGALRDMSRSVFRVLPWFEPGPWGGQWMKNHLAPSPTDVPNLAWSFELIAPENGLVLSDGQTTFEIAFEWLMVHGHRAVLGDCSDWFGHEFPIRFDFLDTVDGGNLSLQCHPGPEYITEHFGETFTQDETYYILDCTPQAEVYLGFRAGVDPIDFRNALERSFRENVPVDVESYVNALPASRHGLFLIPHGTIHCSGKGNLVLEISATPYIFTFKMYDWLRLDLKGQPRPLNIERAFRNLNFERQGRWWNRNS